MSQYFESVKKMLTDLGYVIENVGEEDELLTISDEENGISNLIFDIEDPILVMELVVIPVGENYDPEALLKANRNMVHGAFCLDEDGEKIIWRDTLQLENLDLNEIQGSINALSLAMAENTNMLLAMV